VTIDWPRLRAAALAAAGRAYAPYSGLRVGAAAQVSDGRIVVGCNVENASYGLTLCAECGLVSALHAGGPAQPDPAATPAQTSGPAARPAQTSGPAAGSAQTSGPAAGPAQTSGPPPALVAVSVVAGDGEPLLPCGRCRQLLLEAGGGDLLVDTAQGPVELKALLPAAFTSEDLSGRREPR
jgi:cytidine deaminase